MDSHKRKHNACRAVKLVSVTVPIPAEWRALNVYQGSFKQPGTGRCVSIDSGTRQVGSWPAL